jgi:hypothetical protein
MSSGPSLSLERLEFLKVRVDAAEGFKPQTSRAFPQLEVAAGDVELYTKSTLYYPDDEATDPRHFVFDYAIRIQEGGKASSPPKAPYCVDVEVRSYLIYTGTALEAADRFRAIRFTGYQMMYGAMREMVSNISARSKFGMWCLPARAFHDIAKEKSEEDEKGRQEKLASKRAAIDSPATHAATEAVPPEPAEPTLPDAPKKVPRKRIKTD